MFRVSAQEQFLQQLNDTQIDKIKQQNIGKSQEKQVKQQFVHFIRLCTFWTIHSFTFLYVHSFTHSSTYSFIHLKFVSPSIHSFWFVQSHIITGSFTIIIQQIDTFLRDYRERGTVVLVKITGNSSSIWQISPPSRQLMMHDLLGEKNVTMKFKYEFTRYVNVTMVVLVTMINSMSI